MKKLKFFLEKLKKYVESENQIKLNSESVNESKIGINLRFFLCLLDKLLNDEVNMNGMKFLESLLVLESFMNAIVALCTE